MWYAPAQQRREIVKLTQPKPPAKLATSLENRLKVYALTATAAGVGLLSTQQCMAEVVYTPAKGRLPHSEWIKIDLDHNGTYDFSFFWSSTNYKVLEREVVARPIQFNGGIIGYAGAVHPYASALQKKARIGSQAAFVGPSAFLARTQVSHYLCCYTLYGGPWRDVSDKFLGVKFLIGQEVHYGWIRLSIGGGARLNVILNGYAYETVPNKPILAGQTSSDTSDVEDSTVRSRLSLGQLALGAIGREP
jgi:hypothetical protein